MPALHPLDSTTTISTSCLCSQGHWQCQAAIKTTTVALWPHVTDTKPDMFYVEVEWQHKLMGDEVVTSLQLQPHPYAKKVNRAKAEPDTCN